VNKRVCYNKSKGQKRKMWWEVRGGGLHTGNSDTLPANTSENCPGGLDNRKCCAICNRSSSVIVYIYVNCVCTETVDGVSGSKSTLY